MEVDNRIVVLIDMDCFYCQVEEKLNPELSGKPVAVVQYNPWMGGGIIAVNYVARAQGVARGMRGDEAKEKCPEIELPSVPCPRGKADISKYRDAGKEVARVLQKFTPLLERASIDEAYLDITQAVSERINTINIGSITRDMLPNTYALGYDDMQDFIDDVCNCSNDSIDFDYEHAKQLLVGAVIVNDIRSAVYDETGYRCSAGIGHNKILAKLVCGMNKPNKQTILPKHSINMLYRTLPLKKVKHLGGKFGNSVSEALKIKYMGELQAFTEKELQTKFDDKNGTWLYNIARGVDMEPVQARFNPKSIGCCKNFKGKSALQDLDSLRKWLTDLGSEIEDRLEKDALENNRTPRQMVVSFSTQLNDGRDASSSRSYNFIADDDMCGEFFSKKAFELIMENTEGKIKDENENRKLKAVIKFLGISVGKFEDNSENKKTRKILDFFGSSAHKTAIPKQEDLRENDNKLHVTTKKTKDGKDYIMQKFLQVEVAPRIDSHCLEEEPKTSTDSIAKDNNINFESTLAKQESFFAKYLSKIDEPNVQDNETTTDNHQIIPQPATTPTRTDLNCDDKSNDTAYSTSTINEEINKSIALFEDEPQDLDRVSNIRQLLTSSKLLQDKNYTGQSYVNVNSDGDIHLQDLTDNSHQSKIDNTFQCTECGKTMSSTQYDIHADYHVALKLRDEDRQNFRKEMQENRNRKAKSEKEKKLQITNSKNDITSITNFLVKVNSSTPIQSCTICNKRVPFEKFSEHLDFHEAQKLSRELNKKETPNYLTNKNVKRKRDCVSPIKSLKTPCRSIDSFFKLKQ